MRRVKRPKSKKRSQFIPKKKPFRGVDNTKDIDLILKKNKLFQEMLGVSNENLPSLYDHAIQLLNAHRYEEAESALSLLTKLNPYLPDFWLGLGLSYMGMASFSQAFQSFLMACTMNPYRFDGYENAVQACIEMNNYPQAQAIINQACQFAKRHHFQELYDDAKNLEEKIGLRIR